MIRNFICILLSIFLIFSFTGCNLTKSTTAKNGVNPVTIEIIDNKYYKVTLDFESGVSHKDIGKYYAKALKKYIPDCEKSMDSSLKKTLTKMTNDGAINVTKLMINNIPKEYKDELDGAAEELCTSGEDKLGDGKLSKNELYLYNLGGDNILRPFGCSACSVYGSRTIDGKTIAGKNLDWVPHQAYPLPAVTIFKQGNKSLYSIGSLGQLSVHTGFNKSKIFASTLASTSKDPDEFNDIRIYPYDIRYALENNDSIDSAAAYISDKDHNYYRDLNIFFADATTSKVLENDIRSSGSNKRRELRTEASELNPWVSWGLSDSIASVNSFVLNGNSNGMFAKSNYMRWDSFKRLLNEKPSPVTFEDMKEIMSFTNPANEEPGQQSDGSIYNAGTVFITVFRPDNFKLEISIPPRGSTLPIKPEFVSVPVDFK